MGTTSQTEVLTKPVLHIEARLKTFGDDVIIRTDQVTLPFSAPGLAGETDWKQGRRIFKADDDCSQVRDEITSWLIENFAVLSLGQDISSFG